MLVTNQRTLEETFDAMVVVGGALGRHDRAVQLADSLRQELHALSPVGEPPMRPAVFFEEWDEPLIAGIAWASEIVELVGGRDIFAELRTSSAATGRIVESDEVARRRPDIVIASWCGKKARLERIASRPGWEDVPAVRNGDIFEVKAPDILQPGLSLIHGAHQIANRIQDWQRRQGNVRVG